MSMIHGMPGPGGSLGQCALCGTSFVKETLLSLAGVGDSKIRMIQIDGIDGDLCLHKDCLEKMEHLQGRGWERLPEGPLRKVYAKAAGEASP